MVNIKVERLYNCRYFILVIDFWINHVNQQGGIFSSALEISDSETVRENLT